MTRLAVVALCVAVSAAGVVAQQPAATTGTAAATHVMYFPAEAKWSPAPPSLPAGAEITVIEGDPSKPGLFTMQIRFPAGYRVPPHYHPTDERQTIVKGTLMMGMGETWNESAMKEMTPGAFVYLPAKNSHYVVTKTESVMQLQAEGPFDITYIKPSDDPRKK